jgi:DNA-binding transcriptional LysR family regulator
MLPDIDSLALFVRAAELRSLTKAAEASHIGLAAASRRIALLEHRFKATLLERSSRGVDLTPAGASLLGHAKALLLQLNQMQVEMSDHVAGRKGALRILANTSAMTQYLPGDLARFSKTHPDVRLVVQERWSPEIQRAVIAADADIGIVMEGNLLEGLEAFPYRTDHLSVVAPGGHPIVRVERPTLEEVLDHDLIGLESGSSMMRLLAEQAVVLQKSMRLRMQVRSFEVVCRMVQSGMGVGVLPLQAVSALAEGMGLVIQPLAEPWAERHILLCVKKDRATNPALTLLLDHLRT